MIAPANLPPTQRDLQDRALGMLIAALAADEARHCGAGETELAELRSFWVPDADEIIDEAEALGLLDYEGEMLSMRSINHLLEGSVGLHVRESLNAPPARCRTGFGLLILITPQPAFELLDAAFLRAHGNHHR